MIYVGGIFARIARPGRVPRRPHQGRAWRRESGAPPRPISKLSGAARHRRVIDFSRVRLSSAATAKVCVPAASSYRSVSTALYRAGGRGDTGVAGYRPPPAVDNHAVATELRYLARRPWPWVTSRAGRVESKPPDQVSQPTLHLYFYLLEKCHPRTVGLLAFRQWLRTLSLPGGRAADFRFPESRNPAQRSRPAESV